MNRVPGKARLCGALALILVAAGPLRCGTPIISEFMASNNTTLTDQDGDYADWLELYNPGPSGVNLGGWFLTNKADAPAKWQIPSVTLPAGGYLVIFCSQKNYIDPGAPLATNFNLSSGGGYVGLVEADGKTVASSYTFPVQYPDISYGVSQPASAAEAPQTGYLEVATPGAANGGYANVLLGDTVTISAPAGFFSSAASVTLGGATGAEHIRYVLAGPTSQGDQVAPPSASSQLYTGPITVSSTALLSAAVFSADDTQRGLPSTAMYVQLDAASANRVDTFTSNLPILVYDDNGFGLLPNNHIFYPAWFGAFSPGSDGSATLVQSPDFFTSDTMKLHGFSSASWPKQSYEVSLSDDFGRALPMPLLGLAADKSWDNISLWNIDRTYIHNPFVYSLFRSMGHWAPQARPAEMFIHPSGGVLDYTSYSGITNVTERLKVEANRVNIASIGPGDVAPPAVTGGYLLRIDHPKSRSGTYKYYTWTTSDGTTLFVDTPKLDVLVKPQIDYITGYIQQMQDAMAEDNASGYATRNYLNYLDRPSWVDYHLISVFVENADAFRFSEYFTKDVNGPVVAGPVWDYDRSMGSADGRDVNPLQWTANNVGDYWNDGWWAYVTQDPDFMQLWIDRWQSLRGTVYSTANLTALINSLADQVGPAAAARDAARWPANQSRFGGAWSGEIANMIGWIGARAQWIDQQFVAPPGVVLSGSSRVLTPTAGAKIAYTSDGSDPRLSGGGVSPAASLASGAVTLSAGQAYEARSYNGALAGIDPPVSPWSSPVGGRDRLVNVSGRGLVGGGSNILIEGFVVSGPVNSAEQVLLRADGPILGKFGLAGSLLQQPALSLYDGSGNLLASNTGWGSAPNAPAISNAAAMVGAFSLPLGSADSALLVNLPPGSYTMQISGTGGSTGVALGEIYEVGASGAGIEDLSTRGMVGSGSGALINGFVVSGSGPSQVLVRGDGPSLAQFGVPDALSAPVLQVYDAKGALVASNTGWSANANAAQIAEASKQVGAFALSQGSADCALLLTLQPGAYTVTVTGAGNATGVALAETYAVP